MGYTTNFDGGVTIDKPLDDKTYELLEGLRLTRRMKRNVDRKYGVEGEFYYDPNTFSDFGQDFDNPNIIDISNPPRTQPGLWLQWQVMEDKQTIIWDGGEKFYEYVEWMKYLIDRILAPRGYVVNGEIYWSGEEVRDNGTIIVENNKVRIR